jgi:mediator of RNA polymerase II transcription subunit 12
MDNVYHAISELVRSQTFSVGRYLQWLMAKGVTNRQSHDPLSVTEASGDLGLIAQLPIGRLPEHVANLRRTLMVRTGFSVSDEGVQQCCWIRRSVRCRRI